LPGAYDNRDWPRYVRTTDIESSSTLRSDTFASQPPKVAAAALLNRGDMLMTAAGASIGKSVTYLSDEPACYAGFLVRLRPLSADHGRFLSYWMQSQHYWDQIAVGAVKSTIENFSASRYRYMQAPQPPLSMQRAIADYLDCETAKIDTLIGKQEQLIATLRERRAAVVERAILSASLQRVPLRRFVDVIDCAHVTAEFVEDDGRFPVASIRQCSGPFVDLSSCNYTTREFYEHLRASGRAPRDGDLLFIRNVSVGLVSAVAPGTRDFAVGQETVLLRRKTGVDSLFLRYALTSGEVRDATEKAMMGSTFRRINVAAIRSLPVRMPPKEDQRRIAAYLNDRTANIDALIAKAERFIELAKERRAALITAAVTGQTDVRDQVSA